MIAAIAWFVAGFGTACVCLFAVALIEDVRDDERRQA